MSDIQRADPAARRRALLLVAFGALTGGIVVAVFERYRPLLERWLLSDTGAMTQRSMSITVVLVLAIIAPLFAFAAHLWMRGSAMRRHLRFPLEGERLVRDTPIVRGKAAAVRGRVLQWLACGLVILAIAIAVVLWGLVVLAVAHAT